MTLQDHATLPQRKKIYRSKSIQNANFCDGRILYLEGFCARRILYLEGSCTWEDFVLRGFCTWEDFVLGGLCAGRTLCREDFVPGGFCVFIIGGGFCTGRQMYREDLCISWLGGFSTGRQTCGIHRDIYDFGGTRWNDKWNPRCFPTEQLHMLPHNPTPLK